MTTQEISPPWLTDARAAFDAVDALAPSIAQGASARDRERSAPLHELAAIAQSGLLGIAVPVRHGGPELSLSTVVEVLRRLAQADSSVAQLLLAHFVLQFRLADRPEGCPTATRVFADVLDGAQLGNATAERGTRHGWEHRTRARRQSDGDWTISGEKFYATGALGARWIAVSALVEADHPVVGYVDPAAPGVTLALEDWSSFGQRATHSGTVILDGVPVAAEMMIDAGPGSTAAPPSLLGAYDQALHAAIDVGIARVALEDGAQFIRTRTRPWREAEQDRAGDEPHLVRRVGELKVRLDALEALLGTAGGALDAAHAAPVLEPAMTDRASLSVAAVKALAQELGVEIASGVLELAGTSASDEQHGLDRHWRNVRVHTLHDPARWKYVHIGNAFLNGVMPARNDLF